jgi:hypothetical protein
MRPSGGRWDHAHHTGRSKLGTIAKRALSPALFGVVLVCFFLPFVDVSCQRTQVAELTGLRLITGDTVERQHTAEQAGTPDRVEHGGEPLAGFALLACLAGMALHLLSGRRREALLAGVAGVGFILLLLLKIKLDHEAQQTAEGLFRVHFRAGYWLALTAFGGAGVVNLFHLVQQAAAVEDPGNPRGSRDTEEQEPGRDPRPDETGGER